MARPNPQDRNTNKVDYGQPIKIFDFASGLYTVSPETLLRMGVTPDARNVWYDEENALTKMPGTKSLLTIDSNAYNAFATNPIYNLFCHRTPDGAEHLVIQTSNKIYWLDKQSSYPASVAPTDITPTEGSFTSTIRRSFATYRGRLYMWGGDNLRCYDGSKWTQYNTGVNNPTEKEKFRYLEVYDQSLYAACSGENPTRVIFTRPNHCHFGGFWPYTGDLMGYFPNRTARYMDFPTAKGDPVVGLKEFQGTLLVFKNHSIFRVFGSPFYDTHNIRCVSPSWGTIDIRSVQVYHNVVVFAYTDGLYAYGDTGVLASQDDRRLQVAPDVVELSTEIRNEWRDNLLLPDVTKTVEKVWSGSDMALTLAFTSGGTYEIKPNDTIVKGAASAIVSRIEVTSGTWAAGTAAGTLYLHDQSGDFTAGNLTINNNTDVATISTNSSGFTLAGVQYVEDDCDTGNPPVVIFEKGVVVTADKLSSGNSQTSSDTWLQLNSLGDSSNVYYSNSMVIGGQDTAEDDYSIIWNVGLKLKAIGTLTATQYLKVYITAVKQEADGTILGPDFDNVYASGKIDGVYLTNYKTLSFNSGGVTEIKKGDVITGATSAATGRVQDVFVESGAWGSGDAAGYFWISNQTGTFQNENVNTGQGSNLATLNNGGDSTAFSTGTWARVPMTYWDVPENLYAGDDGHSNYFCLAVKPVGDDASNYIQWGYASGTNLYSMGQMYNSDESTPSNQVTSDFAWKLYQNNFAVDENAHRCQITTTSYNASDLEFWKAPFGLLDNKTIHHYRTANSPYTRSSYLSKVEYSLSADDSSWDSYTEIENGAIIGGTNSKKYIKLRFTFHRPNAYTADLMDSFTLRKIRLSYSTQSTVNTLIGSAFHKGRYWFCAKQRRWAVLFNGSPS